MQERIELHLHTSSSEDLSVITPKDLIETAVKMGHKAVAVTCRNSVQDFPQLEACQCKYGKDIKIIYGAEVSYLKNNTAYSIALLAKNETGLKELYRIISSMRQRGNRKVVDWQVIASNRHNLLCGALTWTATELGDALENEDLYDYIAIVPSGYPQDRERQWQFYTRSRIPVVAVGNCHYVDEEDHICRKIVRWVEDRDYDREITPYRFTNQMLRDFSYLGDNAAYEVVVTNSNLIADQIEPIFPTCGAYPQITISNAEEELPRICREKLHSLYGNNPPSLIPERLGEELALISQNYGCSIYMLLHRLCTGLHNVGAYTGVRGTLGSKLIAYLLEISDTNPLPPHYHCPSCKYTEFVSGTYSGYDLPRKTCPICGTNMYGDGHNLPCTALRRADWISPVNINIASSKLKHARQLLIDCVGENRIARVGCVSVAGQRANGYIRRYQDSCGEAFTKEKAKQIADKLMHIKADDLNIPGGFLLLPEGMEFEDITPVTQLDSAECGIRQRSHLNGYDIDHVLQRINLLGNFIYDRIAKLHRLTGINPEDIDCSDPNIYKLFQNLDTCGIPSFSTDSCKQIMRSVVLQNIDDPEVLHFSDLVRILGIDHGLGTWKDNAANLIKTTPFADLIGNREDIFIKLQEYGVHPQTAYTVMEAVRKGKLYKNQKLYCTMAQELLDAGVPRWYVDSMQKIGYLTSKAHTAHIVKTAVSLAWFKVYYPEEFYNITLQDLGAEEFLHYSDKALLQKLETIDKWDPDKDAAREAIELLLEARHRSIPIDL